MNILDGQYFLLEEMLKLLILNNLFITLLKIFLQLFERFELQLSCIGGGAFEENQETSCQVYNDHDHDDDNNDDFSDGDGDGLNGGVGDDDGLSESDRW